MLAATLRIGEREYRKTRRAVFEVPLPEIGPTRFRDLPAGSTLEVSGLPGSKERYDLSIHVTHDAGNGAFLHIHVTFRRPGSPHDPEVIAFCTHGLRRIRRTFQDLVDSGLLDDGDGEEHRTRLHGSWYCVILYSKYLTHEENPVILETIAPVIQRFEALLRTPDLCLFLCHASEDKAFVDDLANYLDNLDIRLWYDKREIKVGDSIVARVNDGLEAASHLVIVLSKAGVEKPWVTRELSAALMKQLGDRSVSVLPVLRDDCRIPPLLADIRYADCRVDPQAGFAEVVMAVFGDGPRL